MAKTHRASGRAVIIRDNAILLMRFTPAKKDVSPYYNFPGGGVEEGETLSECAKREVYEETGMTVRVMNALFTLEVEHLRYGLMGDPHISVFFRCEVDDATAIISPPHPDHTPGTNLIAVAEWIGIEKLETVNFLPYIPELIKSYVETGVFGQRFISGPITRGW